MKRHQKTLVFAMVFSSVAFVTVNVSGGSTTHRGLRNRGLCSRHQAREPPIKRIVPLAVFTLTLLLATQAEARKWPRPPAWWLNSPGMRCVRNIESKNGAASRNLYGMLDGWTVAGGSGGKTGAWNASYAEQHYRAWLLWKRYGMTAWCPWDGCCPT